MATLKPQDEFIKTALRLPRDLHKQVQGAAESHGRSMNAEIINRLSDSFVDQVPKAFSDAMNSFVSASLEELNTKAAESILSEVKRRIDDLASIALPEIPDAGERLKKALGRLPKDKMQYTVSYKSTIRPPHISEERWDELRSGKETDPARRTIKKPPEGGS